MALAQGDSPLILLVTLAWQFRQRDSQRSLQLASRAEQLLGSAPRAGLDADQRKLRARLALIRGEADWLATRLDDATRRAEAAMSVYAELGDAIGIADSHWLRAMLAIDRGDWPGKDSELEAMARAARVADTDRADIAQAAQAYFAAFRHLEQAQTRWRSTMAAGKLERAASAGCWAEDFLAVCTHHASDFGPAIRHFTAAYTLALDTGQLRRAIVAATNTGDSLNHLNDYDGALQWMQCGLDLARKVGWPASMGVALLQTAHTLRLLGRLDASRSMLREALSMLAPLAASRNHAYALWQLCEVELAIGNLPDALANCVALAERADALQQVDLQSHARRVQAQALLALGQPLQALEAAEAALAFGREAANLQVTALRVIADIHAAHRLPQTSATDAPSVPLHHLQQALLLAAGIEGLTIASELLEATAREYARLGDFRQAYDFSLRAAQSRQTSHSQEARNRSIAMQVTHQTDLARADAELQRRLALAAAERLETLELLGSVGREITRNLQPSAIFAALDHHVHALLDVAAFNIYRVAIDGRTLDRVFGKQAGAALGPLRISLDDTSAPAVRCAREEVEITTPPLTMADSVTEGSTPPRSQIHSPLLVAGRLLGVMSISSVGPGAYSEREVAIFRTLCAYGAIALANGDAQAQLIGKNAQLEVLSVSDQLTGLYNRVRLDHVLKDERARRELGATEMSVILLDLDNFKLVNDMHGHQVGDQVLVIVARLLKESSRHADVVGRWGGEEFLLICRDTALEGAAVLAEKLRGAIAGHVFIGVGRQTGSFGVASLRDGESVDALMARVDAALYRAKRAGRNRVERESPPEDATIVT
ncbi:MAG: diguanylate cyclase [Ideonella sp.]